ncbi:g3335 [Coccomyxa elongata]
MTSREGCSSRRARSWLTRCAAFWAAARLCWAPATTSTSVVSTPMMPQTASRNIYQTPFTPNIQNLTWYNVFGNHDIVINGSVEAQIAYSNTNPKWQMKTTGGSGNYFFADLPSVAGGPKIRAFFVDANPFIAACLNAVYVDAQFTWLDTQLKASTADHNLVLGHYPLFGSATQYVADTTGSPLAYPGNFNAWQRLLQIIYANKVTTYFNGHDHTLTAGNPAQPGAPIPWDGHTTFLTSGAGSWGEPNDSCGTKGALYSGGGNCSLPLSIVTSLTLGYL